MATEQEQAIAHLLQIGWNKDQVASWMKGPQKDAVATDGAVKPAVAETPAPARHLQVPFLPRPRYGTGVRFRDIEHWLMALQNPDLPDELKETYGRRLKLAVDAAQTHGVTPEDIAYWLHALDDPELPTVIRREYRIAVREAMKRYNLEE